MVGAMPIYEFRCAECGSRFEEVVPVGGAVERCPECGAENPQRVLSPLAAPFHLVRTPREARQQARKNAKLRETTKAQIKAERRKAAARRSGDG
jgi:putative FmdB family regulatory protein